MQKRFPHRFLPILAHPAIVHAACQLPMAQPELLPSRQYALGKALIG